MVKEIHVEGFDALISKLDEVKEEKIYILFSGSPGADGKSWCPQCVDAEPVVHNCQSALPDEVVLIHCAVGDRPFWKDPNNIFRTDERFRIRCVPTLLCWTTKNRLEEEQVAKPELVQVLFESD